MADTLGVGVIGCGEIAQIMHLPILEQLDGVRLRAICDVSPGLLTEIGERYGVEERYADYRELLASERLDAVVVCTYEHAEIVRSAIEAGKHVLCEKPLGFTPEEVADLPALASGRGVVALVGYMKLYDPGFELARERIAAIDGVRSFHVHDFGGRFDKYQQLYHLRRARDVPSELIDEQRRDVAARVGASLRTAAAGTAGSDVLAARAGQFEQLNLMLLMLASHDLAVLRSVCGGTSRVAYAHAVAASQVHAVLVSPSEVPVIFEAAVGTRYEWWDEWLAALGSDVEVRVDFADPYVLHDRTRVTIHEAVAGGPGILCAAPSAVSPFRREWEHFLSAIRDGVPLLSDLAGALADVQLAQAITVAAASAADGDGKGEGEGEGD